MINQDVATFTNPDSWQTEPSPCVDLDCVSIQREASVTAGVDFNVCFLSLITRDSPLEEYVYLITDANPAPLGFEDISPNLVSEVNRADCDTDGPRATEVRHSYLMMIPLEYISPPFNWDEQNLL